MEVEVRTATAGDTRAVGEALAPLLRLHDVVVLTGELGAGKTTFVQGIARGLGATEHVASPTFTLVREYVSGRLPLAHVDVYRLERVQDVVDLALEELEGGDCVLLVEWGDAVGDLLPQDRVRVELSGIDPTGADETRRIAFSSEAPTWVARADDLELALLPWRAP
ncbi:MAG TPA: tRNA (adenosine(37)-N6)-threonylcarbamoyltransferase complex ATPase subunit type 1 TsaE [Actinomycetota bacterium]|nr:tRNA (adenosine(37)-N6)-threonylcarbamoyltransferase complex ATPase subunit type 1 TsaE [Actinomycetota bacterium]